MSTQSKGSFDAFLHLLDELLEHKIPLTSAIFLAGERLQEKQTEHHGTLFHPVDLYNTTIEVNHLLRRRPEYKRREKGWAKLLSYND